MNQNLRLVLLVGIWLLPVLPSRAQTFAEWFQQNSTRLQYYAKQIVALQLYLGEVGKGFQISNAGLGDIGSSKQGEFDLHNGYYTSLVEVNPDIGGSAEVTEIATLQAAIIQRFTDALARYRRDGILSADRVAYMAQVYSAVLQAGQADVETLTAVLTDHEWQMTDDQRMGRIRQLDAAMKDRYAFTLAFTDGADMLERGEAWEGTDVGTVKGLYGIP